MSKLGNPQNRFGSIHIAGTNGKGSVSAMLSSVFKTAGFKTGLFISPYIVDFRERIQINGEYISKEDLAFYAQRVIDTGIELTEFEFITAAAFLYFADKNIDILICETGLGGRLDATNVLDKLYAAVITKIGLDHTAILGDTYEKIAKEKCGILRDAPTVTSPYQKKEALNVIKSAAQKLFIPDIKKLEIIGSDIAGSTFIYKGEAFEIGLCGEYQIENALIAIETVKNCGMGIPHQTLYEGLKNASFPARLEVFSKSPLVVLDGAHNQDGAESLAKELSRYSGRVTAVIGMMKDKDVNEVLRITLKHCKAAVAVDVPEMARSMDSVELQKTASKYCPCQTAATLREAVSTAVELSSGEPVFVFGSLYLASAIRPILYEQFKKF